MVRRPAALLIAAYAAALAFFLVAPVLPDAGGGDAQAIASDAPGLLLLGLCVLSLLPARDQPALLTLVALGAGLLAAALTAAEAPAAGNLAKALFAGSAGMLFARWLREPAAALAVPVFVAGIDIASVAGGPAETLARESSEAGEFLSVTLPALGGGTAGVLGVVDLFFVGLFAAWAWDLGLRRGATAVALMAALLGALVMQLAWTATIPVIPLLALAFLGPNLDRLVRALRRGAPLRA